MVPLGGMGYKGSHEVHCRTTIDKNCKTPSPLSRTFAARNHILLDRAARAAHRHSMSNELTTLLDEISIGSARGRKAKPLGMEYVRDLNEGDIEALANPPALGVSTNPIQKIRHAHHLLARLLAEGRAQQEVSLITGYSPSRISILQHDPAFKELVTYYVSQTAAVYLDVHQRIATVAVDFLEELQERIDNDPKQFSNREVMEATEMLLDRSVTAPRNVSGTGGNGGVGITIKFVGPEDKVAASAQPMIDVSPKPDS